MNEPTKSPKRISVDRRLLHAHSLITSVLMDGRVAAAEWLPALEEIEEHINTLRNLIARSTDGG